MSIWPTRVLVYGAGDAVNASGALDTQIQAQLDRLGRVATNRFVAAAAQLDAEQRPALRFVLDPTGRQPVLQLDDVNTGDPAELARFVAWGIDMLPAERTIVVLAGHGVAWQDGLAGQVLGTRRSGPPVRSSAPARLHARRLFGRRPRAPGLETAAVLLDGSHRDFLSNTELALACEGAARRLGAPIDVLVLDACLMMSWEVAFELAGAATTLVASIDELSAAGIDLAEPVHDLSTPASRSAQDLAAAIVHRFAPRAPFDSCAALDLAAPSWRAAVGQLERLASQLLLWVRDAHAHADAVRAALRAATASVVKFAAGGLADVRALADSIAATPGVPAAARAAAVAAADALESCVLARSSGVDYQSALGVSVFCPGSATVYGANRAEYNRLRFAAETGWGALLDALYGFDAPRDAAGSSDVEYRVKIRGGVLDPAARDRVDAAIRSTTLAELAKLDLHGATELVPPAAVQTRLGWRDIHIILGMVFSPRPEV